MEGKQCELSEGSGHHKDLGYFERISIQRHCRHVGDLLLFEPDTHVLEVKHAVIEEKHVLIGAVEPRSDHKTEGATVPTVIVEFNVYDRHGNVEVSMKTQDSVVKILHGLVRNSHEGHLQGELTLQVALVHQQVYVVVLVRVELHVLGELLDCAAELIDLGVGDEVVEGLEVDAVKVEVVVVELQEVEVPLGVEHEDEPVHREGPDDAVRARHLLDEEGVGLVQGLVYQDLAAVVGTACLVQEAAAVAVAQVVAVHELLHVDVVEGGQRLIAEVT